MTYRLTESEKALLPTDADLAFYREHGWWLSKRIYSDAEIDTVQSAADRFYAGERTDTMPGGKPQPWGWKPEHGDTLRKNDWSTIEHAVIRKTMLKPLLGAIAARLASTHQIRLWHDQLLWKPIEKPGKPANVGWHTDRGYWKTCSSAGMLTAWVPFHDCDAVTGGITFVDGSNHWPDNTNNLNFFTDDLEGLEKKFVTGGAKVEKIVPFIPKGCATFHNCLTIHGSGPNRSAHPRRSMALHLQDASNRWQETLIDGKPATHGNDMFVRKDSAGHPDYTDPVMCPVIWEE